jgi:hypothetical protein
MFFWGGTTQLHKILNIHLQVTIKIPVTFTKIVRKQDVFCLLEAQQMEHLLLEKIAASSSASSNLSHYYLQVLMTQCADLEVELYRLAIPDSLPLLEGVYNLTSFSLEGAHRYVEYGEYQDDSSDEGDIQDGGP